MGVKSIVLWLLLTLQGCATPHTTDVVYGAEKQMRVPMRGQELDDAVDFLHDLSRVGPAKVRARVSLRNWVPVGGWISFEIDF